MPKKIWVASSSAILLAVVLIVVSLMSASLVGAQGTKTPSGGIGGFSIPTSTPGGADNTDSSGGGLLIPTSTPDSVAPPANSGNVLSLLGAAELEALNLQPEDLPAAFAANQTITPYTIEDTAAQIEANSKELADLLRQLSTQYGWTNSIGIEYAACDQSLPVSIIYSEVAQFGSVNLARAFVDDPAVTQFYTEVGLKISPVTSVHGFYSTGPIQQGTCFASEVNTYLNFEYWGLLISVSVTASSTTDPAMITDMLDQLAGLVVARVDASANGTLQPTPAGVVAAANQNNAATATKVPFSLNGSNSGNNTQNNTTQTGSITLADIDAAMPTIDEIGLPTDIFALNTQLSTTQTVEQVVAFWQSAGLTDIATAIGQAMQQSGALGQVVRVWDTGSNCPQTVGITVEVDVMLFQDENGPTTFLNNQNYFNTLTQHGMYIQKMPDGGITSSLYYTHLCGDVQSYARTIPHGRYLISVSVIAYLASDQATVEQAAEGLAQYTAQKLDQIQ